MMPASPIPELRSRALPDEAAIPIQLPLLTALEAARLLDQASTPGPRLIGFGRLIPDSQQPDAATGRRWQVLPDGRHVLAFRVTSPGAAGLRVGLRILALPDTASLRFFRLGAEQAEDIPGALVNASVRRNRDAGAMGEAAEMYWSPLIEGDTLVLEIELPAGLDPGAVRISLPRLSHFLQLPATRDSTEEATAGCSVDVHCHPAWSPLASSTAILLYTRDDGGSGLCSGTLLNDADPATVVPYFLTAHHCVPDQARASSLETYWFAPSRDCGGALGGARAVTGGADLLYAARTTDTNFLRLRRPPPAGTVLAGWSAATPVLGTPVAGLHHSLGAPCQLALGAITGELNCAENDTCGDPSNPDEVHYWQVTWVKGFTGPGSSGSGLFLDTGQLVGTLYGGFSRCDNPHGPDDYGRFDLPYRAALYRWLGPH